MNITKATARYEKWLSRHLRLIKTDLVSKHEQMRGDPFPFFRATYYRWAQVWEGICEDAAKAPKVLGVGDLHVENFGTWRDIEGRLIWGINDFDEVWRMPYTNDLVRLATSALMAQMVCEPKEAMEAFLEGYKACVAVGGKPFALAEHHHALRQMAVARLKEPEKFWERLHALPEIKEPPPVGARKALQRLMPERDVECRIVHRIAGLGSLGRQRYVAIAEWRGGSIAREAKALAPSACVWAEDDRVGPILYQEMLNRAVRCRDPFVRFQKRWIVRRLAPDCSRIELSALPAERDELRLVHAMGWETANVHLGTAKPKVLGADLAKRPKGWLYRAAKAMEKALLADFEEFKKAGE